MKSFATLLLLSQGVPMILAGDEFGRSQMGNNNCWCQDNEISWLDWSLLTKNSGFHRFFKKCIQLRKQYPVFRREEFFLPEKSVSQGSRPEITWQYLTPGTQNWAHDCRGLAFHLHVQPAFDQSCDFFIMINTHRDRKLRFSPPLTDSDDSTWQLIIDTTAESPDDFPSSPAAPKQQDGHISVPPFGCIVLQSSVQTR